MSSGLPDVRDIGGSRISVLQMSAAEAKTFFLKDDSYSNMDFPSYINFDSLLSEIDTFLVGKNFIELRSKTIRDSDSVNHTLFTNKDGRYAWRPLELIHPVLYVELLRKITDPDSWQSIIDRFGLFATNDNIDCLSMPVESTGDEKDKAEQISQWWHEVEQKSIELALDYSYLIKTDITNCYGSIYTHSIAWSMHERAVAKTNRQDKTLIGNQIDWHIQDMRQGQTNGIPQGSVLMDFIAEMVLGYADMQLTNRLAAESIDGYKILRYRDDYRVFVNNPRTGERIIKELTAVLIDLGLKLNPTKTKASSSVIKESIKSDKLDWIFREKFAKGLLKSLLILHDHATNHPSSGSLKVALSDYQKRLEKYKIINEPLLPMISVIVDIGFSSPATYPVITAILSKLINMIDDAKEKIRVIGRIRNRFTHIPNTGYLDIWLQRITLNIEKTIGYNEPICKVVAGEALELWNSDWITSTDLKKLIDPSKIIDPEKIGELDEVIGSEEVAVFTAKAQNQFPS